MTKKKSTPKKKTVTPKSNKKKCVNNKCEVKSDCQKICNNQLPTLDSTVIKSQNSCCNFWTYIKRLFGYG